MTRRILTRVGAERLRKVFWMFAILAVFLNLFDDVNIYFRNSASNQNAVNIDLSIQARRRFEQLVALLFNGDPQNQAEAKAIVEELNSHYAGNPAALAAVKQLEQTFATPVPAYWRIKGKPYRDAVLRARAEIDKVTQDQIDIDQRGDRRTESLVLVANMVDLGLIFTLLAVYFLEWRVKDGIETALNRSVEDLRASNLRLQEGIMARARKLKVAAHDIKSPLAALKGYSEIACETTRSDQPIARLLQRMDSLTNSTLEMVNSLFAENGEVLPPSIVNIDNVLAEVCSASTSLARQKKQYIEYSGHGKSSLIEGNRNELLRCFYNLIDNAIKYSPVGAKIKVQWRADAERVRVTIIDQGPGFNTQDFVEMFSPGKTLSARPTAGESSSGYGLYSTKKIIEDHHGSIDIHNLDGRGAAIEIELPRQAGKFNRAFSEA